MKKRPDIVKWVVIPIILLLLAVLIDLVVGNAGLLFLPKEERGVFSIQAEERHETDAGGRESTTLVLNPKGYIHKATISMPRAGRSDFLQYKAYMRKPDMKLIFFGQEFMPPFSESKDTVSIRATAEEIHFVFEEDIEQASITVNNNIALNKRRIMVWFVGLLCGWLLFALRKTIGKKLEIGFLVVACTIGLSYAVVMPAATYISFDDTDHLARCFELGYNHDGSMEEVLQRIRFAGWSVTQYSGSNGHSFNTVEDNTRYYQLLNDTSLVIEDEKPTRAGAFYDIAYITQALGLWSARIMGLPLQLQIVAGRLGNFLMYTLVCYFAIKMAKRYKAIFYVIALGPIALFTAGSYSADPTVNAFCLLGFSIFISELLTPDKPLMRSRAMVMLAAFVICAMPKAIYGILLGLPLLLPAGKFESSQQKRWFKIITLTAMLLVIASFALPVLLGTSEHSDVRIEGTSVSGQIKFMLSHPITATGIFLKGILQNSLEHLLYMQLWFPYLNAAGNTLYSAVRPAMNVMFFVLLLFVIFTDKPQSDGMVEINKRQRRGVLALLLSGILLVWASMYLSYTAVGSNVIYGVQGRYYIPLIPLAAVLLNMRNMSGGMERSKYNLTVVGCNAVCMFIMLTSLSICNFWL